MSHSQFNLLENLLVSIDNGGVDDRLVSSTSFTPFEFILDNDCFIIHDYYHARSIYNTLLSYCLKHHYVLDFVTIQPSREYLYVKYGFMTPAEQLAHLLKSLKDLKLSAVSISIEHGANAITFRTFFHFHIIFQNATDKQLKALRSYYTSLHLLNRDGYQTAVVRSKENSNLPAACRYWSGFFAQLPDDKSLRRKGDHLCTLSITDNSLEKNL